MAPRPDRLLFSLQRQLIFGIILLSVVHSTQGTDEVFAILGNTGVITCPGYDKVRLNSTASGGNISDVYSLRFFKNVRSTDYIVFTFLDMPPHRIRTPQNEWKDRNITFAMSDQPQILLPNVTFRDDATYICDLTPASRNTPVISETRFRVVACPETVEVTVINSTTADLSIMSNRNTTTPASLYPLSAGTPTFQRGTGIQIRCTTVTYPAATLSLSIPALKLFTPDWQNLTESPGDRAGYTRRTLEAYFTLNGPDNLFQGAFTVDCRSSVANGTCTNTNSLAMQVFVPQTTTRATTTTTGPPTTAAAGGQQRTGVTESLRSGSTGTMSADVGQPQLPQGSTIRTSNSTPVPPARSGCAGSTEIVAGTLTGGQIAGIVVGCAAALMLISGLVYFAVRHKNKDLSCKKPQGYSVTGMGVNGKNVQQRNRRDISHPKAITAYPQHPCPKTGSVTFVDASALL